MKVEFCVSDDAVASEEDCRILAVVTGHLAQQVGVDFDAIDEVLVATPDRFRELVVRFDPTGSYTNARGLVAAGKTIAHRKPGLAVTNSILLQYGVAREILDAPVKLGKNYDSWPAEQQRCHYVLFHELGHCLDHARRTEPTDDGTFRDAAGRRSVNRRLKEMCRYNYTMLLSELAACAHAGFAYTDGIRQLDCQMNDEFMTRQLSDVLRMTVETPHAIEQILDEAMGLSWFILFQHAKFSGAMIGNSELPRRSAADLWEIARAVPQIAAIIDRVDHAMEKAWPDYPEFSDGLEQELSKAVVEIACICGYRFQDANGRDGIWWDRPTQRYCRERLDAQAKIARAVTVSSPF